MYFKLTMRFMDNIEDNFLMFLNTCEFLRSRSLTLISLNTTLTFKDLKTKLCVYFD